MRCSRISGTGERQDNATFPNWAGDYKFSPSSIFRPVGVDEIVSIVREAARNRATVHALGSGWSFNDNFMAGSGGLSYMIFTGSLNRILSNTMGATSADNAVDPSAGDPVFAALTPAARERKLVHVECGIKVHDLCEALDGLSVIAGRPRGYGFAVATLGGSGGQSIMGAISTSTHGGDVNLRPLPDMVQGVHLVGAGGVEFFIQRGGAAAIVDTDALGSAMPCVAGRIISDDDALYSVIVAMGRMGIIYSLVVEVVDQFALEEKRYKDSWNSLSANAFNGAGGFAQLRAAHHFLQVVVLPYASSGDHVAFVTTRCQLPATVPLKPDPDKNNLISAACRLQPLEKSAVVLGLIAAATAAAVLADGLAILFGPIPFVGEAFVAAAAAANAAAAAHTLALSPQLVPSITIGDYIAAVTNLLDTFELTGVARDTVNGLLASQLGDHDITDLSYRVMDTYDYQAECYKARSLEVAFDADSKAYIEFVNEILGMIQDYSDQHIIYGGYISLRFCKKSNALLAIEQWENTVCIEMSSLAGLDSDIQVLNSFEATAARHNATIHWGQLNNRTRPDIEHVFANTITKWRVTLARLTQGQSVDTFDNDFCQQRGLEIYDARWKKNPDISYLVPLLLS
jgi:hypothetical protein